MAMMTDVAAVAEDAARPDDDEANPAAIARRYKTEIDLWFKESKDWHARGDKIVKRFRAEFGEADRGRRLNLLWSNVQTLLPALYARQPKPVVERAYKDSDPVGRVAAALLERAIERNIAQSDDFHTSMRAAVLDRLLAGRGTIWARYQPTFRQVQPTIPLVAAPGGASHLDPTTGAPVDADAVQMGANGPFMLGEPYDALEFENVDVDYVDWRDFGHTAGARTWEEVCMVFRRVYLGREQLRARFGDAADKVTLDYSPKNQPDDARGTGEADAYKKATVYEIWDRDEKRVVWIAESHKDGPLDMRDDPLRLRGFFPCPRPIYATLTSDSLLPVPDFKMYEDLAREVDDLTDRISRLTEAMAVKGVYNSEFKAEFARLIRGRENDMIPVEAGAWAMFGEKGGFAGAVQWFPIDMVANALTKLIELREVAKRSMYEVTGLSDIIRGQAAAAATATEQRIKGQFASLRLNDLQGEVQRFSRDTIRIIGEIIAEHFQPETIADIGGARGLLPTDQQHVPAAIQLLRDDAKRGFVIDIETDSTIAVDEQEEKGAVNELMQALGGFMAQWAPVVQQQPAMLPVVKELLLFAVRRYRAGRSLEGVIEQALDQMAQQAQQKAQQPPPPDPKVQAQQAALQLRQEEVQMRLDADQAKARQDGAIRMQEHQDDMRLEREKLAVEFELKRVGQLMDAQIHQEGQMMRRPVVIAAPGPLQ